MDAAFVFPPAWHRHRAPRRSSAGLQRFTPRPAARQVVDELLRGEGGHRSVLDAPSTPEPVRLAARDWLAGKPDATPFGAGAAAGTVAGGYGEGRAKNAFADVWVAEHGLRFAAEAAVTVMTMTITDDFHRFSGPEQHLGIRPMRADEGHRPWLLDAKSEILLRVRAAIAAAPDEDYAEVVAALAPYRSGHPYAAFATSVLAPTEPAWVEADIAAAVASRDDYRASLLLTAATTAGQVAELTPVAHHCLVVTSMTVLTSLVEGVGPAAAPALFHWLHQPSTAATEVKRLLGILAELGGEAVLRGLLECADAGHGATALQRAAERFPETALRVLAESGSGRLAAHVCSHPGLAEAVRPALSGAAAARVERIIRETASMTAAPASALPPLLTDPPWRRPAKPVKPVVITGLSCDDPATIDWRPGEREAWRTTPFTRYGEGEGRWESIGQALVNGTARWYEGSLFFTGAPAELARPLLAGWQIEEPWEAESWMRVVIARFELDALPPALRLARRAAPGLGALLLPLASPEIAVLAADWLSRLKSLRKTALTWLLRHPAPAARALIPPALGKAGAARRQAERALLTLDPAVVREAAGSYGPEASAAIETLLATDPLTVLPAKVPPAPAWAAPAVLPPVHLRDGSGALPPEAVGHVLTILSISKLDDPYAGLEVVRQACEPGELAEFAWAVFQAWQSSGADPKENWALGALGLLGDDETVRRLTPVILAWPGAGGHAKAVAGIEVLAAIGSDVALMHLHGIAQRARFKGLKSAAEQKMAEVADGLGLSADQLADRLVPDFGLAADGSLRLDYGPRQFVVGFDEQLRPCVTDAAGKVLKALPKPGVRDDAALAGAAYKQFAALKKDVRTVAADQVRRLERAMVTGRRWTGAEFRQLLVAHPLLRHVVRRLVWLVEGGGAFRVAEDRSLSTVDDERFGLADDAVVGVAHPVHLGAATANWVEVFADYEILQPFPQLARPVHQLTPEEAAGDRLTRFEGVRLPTTRVIGLERSGWRRAEPEDAGMQNRIELLIGPERQLTVELEPGIAIGALDHFPEQTLTEIYLHDGTGSRWSRDGRGRVPLGRLDPVMASEVLRDLSDLTS